MDSAAVCGKNMKNVTKPRELKRVKCPDRREDITYGSLPRIKKIMQRDAEVGRIAMAVPVIISRALEMFLKSLLTKIYLIAQSKLSAVVSVAHMKQCIESEKLFDFLKDLTERVTSTAAQKDNRGMSVWPLYRTKQREISVKKPAEVVEMAPRRSPDSLDNDSSSGESELYICL